MNDKSPLPLIIGLATLAMLGYLAWSYSHVLSSGDNMAELIRGLALLLFIGPAILAYRSSSHFLKHLSIWLGIGFGLAVLFTYQTELQSVWGRVSGQMAPSSGTNNPDGSVTYIRGHDGHFHVEALVNGHSIRFLVDTGASRVSLSDSDAKRLGYDMDSLSYDMLSQTANGEIYTASVTLPVIKVGPIEIREVQASVNRNLAGQSLLGMSFLNKLKKFSIEGDKLVMAN